MAADNEQEWLTTRQVKRMVFLEAFGTGALFMPVAASQVRHGACMTAVIGLLLAFLLGAYLIWLSGKQGGFSGTQTLDGRMIHLIYAARFWIRGAVLLFIFEETVRRFLLPGSNVFLTLLPLVLVTGYGVLRTVAGRGRLLELLFWWVLVPVLLIWILSVAGWQRGTIAGQSFAAVGNNLQGTVVAACRILLLFLPLESILYFMPRCMGENKEKRKESQSAALSGLVAGLLVDGGIFAMAFLTVGETALREDYFGVINMLQTISTPGNVITRPDILVMPFFILGLFILFSGSVFYGCKAWEFTGILQIKAESRDGRLPVWKMVMCPYVVLVALWLFVSFYGDFERVLDWYLDYGIIVDLPLCILLPLIFLWNHREDTNEQKKERNRKNNKKAAFKNMALVFLCGVAGLLSGCAKVDIEDRDYVLMLGIDEDKKASDSGPDTVLEQSACTYSVAMADMQGYKAETGESVKMKTAEDTKGSLAAFRDSYSRNHAATMDFGHVTLLLFQEDIAQNGSRFEKLLKDMEEERLVSGTVLVAVARGTASEFIKMDEDSDLVLSQAIANMLEKDGNVAVTLQELYLAENEDQSIVIPVLEIGEEDVPQIVDYVKI